MAMKPVPTKKAAEGASFFRPTACFRKNLNYLRDELATGDVVVVRLVAETTETEEYLHEAVWFVVERQIAHARAHPRGSLFDHLVAMVFSYHTLEGYLNYLGDKVAPDTWKDEKSKFKKDGITGKLDYICELCGIPKFPKGKRPYSTIRELRSLRDQIAHPKTRKTKRSRSYSVDSIQPVFEKSYLQTVVSLKKVVRVRDDVKHIIGEIHTAARTRFPRSGLETVPLGGMHSRSVTSSEVQQD